MYLEGNFIFCLMEILVVIILLALCVAGLSIKLFFGKEFKGTCSTQNVNNDGSCSICGKDTTKENCEYEKKS